MKKSQKKRIDSIQRLPHCKAMVMREGDFFLSACMRRVKNGGYCYQHKFMEQQKKV